MIHTRNKITIGIWGASTTEGFYDTEAGGWADRIKQYLSFENGTHVFNLGVSGAVSTDLVDRFDMEAKYRKPDIIIISLGTNDAGVLIDINENQVSIDDFTDNIKSLLEKSKKYTDNIVIVCSIPVNESVCNPWRNKLLYLNEEIKKYNSKAVELAKEYNVKYIDLFDKFKNDNYKELLHDGLHPNSAGHKLMFDIIKNNLDL